MHGRLDRERILDLFGKLSAKLEMKGVRAHIYLVGGAMMTLTWSENRTTWDIDGRIDHGHREVTEAVLEIARAENLRARGSTNRTRRTCRPATIRKLNGYSSR